MRFKLFGTEIYISFLFAAMLTFMLATDRTGLIIPTLFASVFHETGHLFCMWVMDCAPVSIKLIPTSIQIVRGFSKKKCGEVAIALCGPLCNFFVFLALYINYTDSSNETVLTFGLLNLIIGLFNLLPVKGLDGGTVLFSVINRFFGITAAERTVKLVTALLGAAALAFGIFAAINGSFNLSVFIIALYLIISVIIKI